MITKSNGKFFTMSIKAKAIIALLVAVILFGFWNVIAFAFHIIGVVLIIGAILWIVFHTPTTKS